MNKKKCSWWWWWWSAEWLLENKTQTKTGRMLEKGTHEGEGKEKVHMKLKEKEPWKKKKKKRTWKFQKCQIELKLRRKIAKIEKRKKKWECLEDKENPTKKKNFHGYFGRNYTIEMRENNLWLDRGSFNKPTPFENFVFAFIYC